MKCWYSSELGGRVWYIVISVNVQQLFGISSNDDDDDDDDDDNDDDDDDFVVADAPAVLSFSLQPWLF